MGANVPAGIEIWHIAMPVDDLERSVKFYHRALGFDLIGRDEDPSMRQAFVALGRGGFTIELFAPLGEDENKPRLRPDHLAFERANIETYRSRLAENGLSVPEIETFSNGMKHFEIRDPDGVRLDFFQGRRLYDTFLSRRLSADQG